MMWLPSLMLAILATALYSSLEDSGATAPRHQTVTLAALLSATIIALGIVVAEAVTQTLAWLR